MRTSLAPGRFIIIIGAARSGTKFLRDTLAAAGDSAAIPYDINHIWRLGHESHPHDEFSPDLFDADTANRIRQLMEKSIKGSGVPANGHVIEKTVSNCLRVEYVHRIFPDAHYIHLVRDGRAVVESSYRQWTAKPDIGYLMKKFRSLPLANLSYLSNFSLGVIKNIIGASPGSRSWGPRYQGIDEDVAARELYEVCAIQWSRCVKAATDAFDRLQIGRFITVRYEDLVSNSSEIRRVCDAVGLEGTGAVIDKFESSVQRNHQNRWESFLDEEKMAAVLPLLQDQMQRHLYEMN